MCCSFNFHDKPPILESDVPMQKFFDFIGPKSVIPLTTETAPSKGLDLTPVSGKRKGLTLVLDSQSYRNSPRTANTDFYGFLVAATDQLDASSVLDKGFLVPAGQVSQVALSANAFVSDESLRDSMTPKDRGCYFNNEYSLDIFAT
jgi:hypothetical protein